MTDSQQLLADYVETGSETAFREVVTRYLGLVYSTALRLVEGDSHRAEDVAQTVFVDLARQARTFSNDIRLGGWLHRHTYFVATMTMRGERRRQSRERQAAEMNALQDNSADFSSLAPILDEAINALGDADRTAILLRFYEQLDFRAVGAALGSSEDAARMRVTRALEKLALLLTRRGVTASAVVLAAALSANAVQAAPTGLAVAISSAAALAGTQLTATATPTIIKTIVMTNLQKTLIVAALATPVLTGMYEYSRVSQARNRVQALEEEQSLWAAQVSELGQQQEYARKDLVAAREENERLKRQVAELHQLRGQVAQRKEDSAELARLKAATPEPEAKLRAWVSRALQLKQRFERMPDQQIPELQFITDQDMLKAVEHHQLDTEVDCRQAMSKVRNSAVLKFVQTARKALIQYAQTDAGQFPSDLSQLKSYFESPVDDAILARWEIVPSDKVDQRLSLEEERQITEKSLVDAEYDNHWVIGLTGFRGMTESEMGLFGRRLSPR